MMPHSQLPRKERPRRVVGSLARRILLLCLALLILPLIIHTFLLRDRDYRLTVHDLFVDLELVGQGEKQLVHQWIHLQERSLALVDLLMANRPFEEQERLLKQMGAIQGAAHYFICKSDGSCLSENRDYAPSLQLMEKALDKGSDAFIAQSPESGKPYIFILKRRMGGGGAVGISVAAAEWVKILASFERSKYPVDLSLVQPSGKIIASTRSDIKKKDFHIFQNKQWEKWEHARSIFDAFQMQNRGFALEIPLGKAEFTLLVSIPASALGEIEGKGIFINLAYLLAAIIIVGGLLTLWLTRRMARPMRHLHGVMDRVSGGDLNARYAEDRMGFEINALGSHFNQMVGSLVENIETARIERFAKEALAKELNIGHEIQKSLLPEALDAFGPLTLAAALHPAREVAGDFYDLFKKSEEELMVAVADGSDKGISACLYSLMVRSMLRQAVMETSDLKEALLKLNDLFCLDTGDTGNFVTAWVGVFDAVEAKLRFCSMGHFPGYLIRHGKALPLNTKGQALGAGPMEMPEMKTISLEKGDLLFLYTDGLVEARARSGELFGGGRLIEILEKNQYKTPREIVDWVLVQVEEFSPKALQQDDLTALAIKY